MDRQVGIDEERDNTVTARVDRLVCLPSLVRQQLQSNVLELPLGMFRPGYQMPVVKPPGIKGAKPIEITERDSTFEGILKQKETAVADGIDPNKSYFVGIHKAFGVPIRRMTQADRDELPPRMRDQLRTFEQTMVALAKEGNVMAKYICEELLGLIVNLADGNHR